MHARRAYISKIVKPLSRDDIDLLFKQASQFNESVDITGFLYCGQDHYVQFLEGPKTELFSLMERIHVDPRHDIILDHSYAEVSDRLFGSWFLRKYPVCHEIANILAAPIFLTGLVGKSPKVSMDFHKATLIEACELISELNDFWTEEVPLQRTASAG